MIITIDGPAGTGKTTIAREVAQKLGFACFDTGAMYRAFTYQVIQEGLNLNDSDQLALFLQKFQFEICSDQGKKSYLINGKDITNFIRSSEVTSRVSEVSANPLVRQVLIKVQREFARGKSTIFEGRDMGTVVFPRAEVKVFLTARPSVRAERRYLELKEKNALQTEEQVLHELLERDHLDSTREVSPLKQAEGAHLIDTSDLTIQRVIDRLVALIPS